MAASYDLKKFKTWIEKAIENIESAIKETDEMQKAFNGEYVDKFKLSYNGLLNRVTEETVKLYFNNGLDQNSKFYKSLKTEKNVKNKTLAVKKNELEKKITGIEKNISDIKIQKNSLISELKKANPELDRLEEAQKIIVSRHEGSALTLKTNMESLKKGFGFFINCFTINKLKNNLKKEIEVLVIEKTKLQQIRNDYFKRKTGANNKLEELEETYRENIEIAAEVRKDLSALETAFETTCILESVIDILEKAERPDLNSIHNKAGDMDEFIKKRDLKIDFEKSLKMVAEEIGFLTGIKSGFLNLKKTAESLLNQYNNYKSYLKPINFNISDKCENFCDNFKIFANKIIDDNKLSKTPADFIKLVSPFHKELLNEKTVKSIFEEIAEAIKNATKNWKNK